ncbi:PRP38-domain-containing protein [Dothidotthia symphoricarpi CBS 119687]|uniref:Pre-mRNA-splicing factor 38 n=1 Tax=Dothidotthia symphoricarpi CBS 119687 TaxID=1392245 RepID=A0A6A6A519_9PLEO|nr:PRP38-domain-containing protein [Dothidotthia symphoricarpi CBS 119687]KAF2126263.1 PRP38-domain-containing protein [Dothidotthia symphoricarpi CBS 119687]
MSKPAYDKADARALLDDRGYSGALIRGQNPALLFEKGVRDRITESYYWKEQCFGLNAATLCDRAADLKFIGGTTGIMGKPTPFLCLAFKMLQLVPDKAIVLEYLNFKGDEDEDEDEEDENGKVKKEEEEEEDKEAAEEGEQDKKEQDLNAAGKLGSFKYLRCLAAFYIRLAWEPVEIYKTLEPLLTDYRKIKRRLKDAFTLTYMDQFIDDLLTKDRICATSLWKLPSRANLEDLDMLDPRESPLGDEIDALDEEMGGIEDGEARSEGSYRSPSRSYDSRSRSRSRSYDSRSRSRSRSVDSRDRRRTRSPGERSRSRSRRRSRSRDGSRDRSS